MYITKLLHLECYIPTIMILKRVGCIGGKCFLCCHKSATRLLRNYILFKFRPKETTRFDMIISQELLLMTAREEC
jgi:hypothetical protein